MAIQRVNSVVCKWSIAAKWLKVINLYSVQCLGANPDSETGQWINFDSVAGQRVNLDSIAARGSISTQ